MAEVTAGMTADELSRKLIASHRILIKNLSAKIKQEGREYIRIAVKNTEENDKLLKALRSELQ